MPRGAQGEGGSAGGDALAGIDCIFTSTVPTGGNHAAVRTN
jgi:hypothetical protein